MVSEWSKEHDWKSCIGQPIVGSNPTRSAIFHRSVAEDWIKTGRYTPHLSSAHDGCGTHRSLRLVDLFLFFSVFSKEGWNVDVVLFENLFDGLDDRAARRPLLFPNVFR